MGFHKNLVHFLMESYKHYLTNQGAQHIFKPLLNRKDKDKTNLRHHLLWASPKQVNHLYKKRKY